MKIQSSICDSIKDLKTKPKHEVFDEREEFPIEAAHEKSHEAIQELNPRDGMSLDSAKFIMGRCTDDEQYEIHGIENKGRYFIAKIVNTSGTVVNELLVDKLNGTVKFLRGK